MTIVMHVVAWMLAFWMLFGWLVVGLITLRHRAYFKRIGVLLYMMGGLLSALLWPSCVHLAWSRRSPA